MNERELELTLRAIGRSHVRQSAPPRLHERMRDVSETPSQSGFLSSLTWRFGPMFSATKFVVASVIVALFAGFLLVGVLNTQQDGEVLPAAVTESPSPMTNDEILPGVTLILEEVEPGVFRVVSDGVRDTTHSEGGAHFEEAVMVDAVGRVWRSQRGGHVYRLGTEHESSASGLVDLYQGSIEAIPDGRLVTVAAEGLRVFDGESWAPDEYGIGGDYSAIAVQDDGTVWLGSDRGLVQTNTGRPPEWFGVPDSYDGVLENVDRLAVNTDGVVWLMGRDRDDGDLIDAFLGFDGSDWEVVPAPDGATTWQSESFDVGPDGTLWTVADASSPHHSLARYDGSDWTIFGEVDGVLPWGDVQMGYFSVDMVGVAPDGSAWVNATRPSDSDGAFEDCDGLGRYDGESWASYLSGMCVADYDFAPDGAVWVVVRDWDETRTDTYVITSEAVAATSATGEG